MCRNKTPFEYECDFSVWIVSRLMVRFAQRIRYNSSFPKIEALSGVLTLGKVELHFETLRKLHHKP